MARVGFDLDGVLYKFTKAFVSHVNKCKPHLNAGDPDAEAPVWDWFESWPMSRQEFLDEMDCATGALDLFWYGELYERDIPKQIRRLQEEGHTVHVVTHRFSKSGHFTAESGTNFWLMGNGIFPDSITFSKDKTVVQTDYFLEDNLDNYRALLKAGVDVWLVDRPYNQLPDHNGWVARVNTTKEFVDYIIESERAG